ncbi:hypothetical protein OKW43_007819 [Paraburkholderia sp. WC7.3g]|uniref:hypothetical protein n=1 Tax=Paraburkholderia sp. WC7.3g TaxID=2991070 RepID=UPI003D1DB072
MDKTDRRWRVGLYKSANDHLGDVVTSQSRGALQLVKIEGDPAQAVPVGEPLPGPGTADRAAAIARLAIDTAMTR